MQKRGNFSISKIVTPKPRRANCVPAAAPAGPPPIMATSVDFSGVVINQDTTSAA